MKYMFAISSRGPRNPHHTNSSTAPQRPFAHQNPHPITNPHDNLPETKYPNISLASSTPNTLSTIKPLPRPVQNPLQRHIPPPKPKHSFVLTRSPAASSSCPLRYPVPIDQPPPKSDAVERLPQRRRRPRRDVRPCGRSTSSPQRGR